MKVCMKCHYLAEDTILINNFLVLCKKCNISTVMCQEFHHNYRGAGDGTWICIECGHKLESPQEKPEKPKEEPYYYDD